MKKQKTDNSKQLTENPELEQLRGEKEELENLAKRTQADFVNFRNRMEIEKKDWIKYGETQVLMDLIQVLDNFSQAAKHVPEDLKDNQWVQGIQNIEKQFEEILKAKGVEKIECLGEQFDPNFHEAMLQEESDEEEGTVLEVFAEGYKLGDKVIRAAKVKVAKAKG
jgi:molecular chaperone GrpE